MNAGKKKSLSLQSCSKPPTQSSISSFFPKAPAAKTGFQPQPPKPTAAIRPQPDFKPKSPKSRQKNKIIPDDDDDIWDDDIFIVSKDIPKSSTHAVRPVTSAKGSNPKVPAPSKKVVDNPFLSSSDDESNHVNHAIIDEIISDDSPTKSPVINRRCSPMSSQKVRKPLFQPRQSTLTQLAVSTSKPVEETKPAHQYYPKYNNFDNDSQTIVDSDNSSDIWDNTLFQPKTSSPALKTSTQLKSGFVPQQSKLSMRKNFQNSINSLADAKANGLPSTSNSTSSDLKTLPSKIVSKSKPDVKVPLSKDDLFDFDTDLLLPDDGFEEVQIHSKDKEVRHPNQQTEASQAESQAKIEQFEFDVMEWVKKAGTLKTMSITGPSLTLEFLKDAKREAKGIWQIFNDLCIAMLSLNMQLMKSELATKMRSTALFTKAKLLMIKKRLANFPKENRSTTPVYSNVFGEHSATPLRENSSRNFDFVSPGTSGYSSRKSDAFSCSNGSFQDHGDFQDRGPALQPSERPAEEVNYMSAIYQKPSPQSQKSRLALQKDKDKFHSKFRNDADDPKFKGYNFPHSEKMRKLLKEKFGLAKFRPNQLEAINAALLNNNCFVLMPTGGGKSLCYQLSALVTGGVTIVVSPLKSLILDQVNKLNTLGIPAAHLSGEMSMAIQNDIYHKLSMRVPGITLLYVTPEKLSASNRLVDTLSSLYRNRNLSRFVIDEAHCVSQWGHDFRPDYKKLSALREKFPDVPTMALTATATPVVRTDVLHQLRMDDPKWFLSSFNRPNLQYSVRKKEPKSINQLLELLKSPLCRNKCGIVYCFSRNDCEKMADTLQQNNIQAEPYHAGLSDKKRADVQHLWTLGTVKVMCATIAFGMGIDKPDVRFVIHNSIAQSIEGYYQEAGRAGRDGELAHCILFYSYADVRKIVRMIEDDPASQEVLKSRKDNLYRMAAFCDNKVDCRRSLQLKYFGETFNRENCLRDRRAACDNCLSKGTYDDIDCIQLAKDIVNGVKAVCGLPGGPARYTLPHFIDVLKGSKNQKVMSNGHDKLPIHGKTEGWDRTDVERLLHKMMADNFLYEEYMITIENMSAAYLRIGPECHKVFSLDKYKFPIKRSKSGQGSGQGTPVMQKVSADEEVLFDIRANCLKALQEKIREIALDTGVAPSTIANPQALIDMSRKLPEKKEDMLKLQHVTEANYNVFGAQLLKITTSFASAADEILALHALDPDDSDEDTEELMNINAPEGTATASGGFSRGGRGGFRGRGGRKFTRKRKNKTPGGPAATKRFKAGGRGQRGARNSGHGTSRGPSGETVTTRPGVNRGIQSMPVPMGRGNIRNLRVSMS